MPSRGLSGRARNPRTSSRVQREVVRNDLLTDEPLIRSSLNRLSARFRSPATSASNAAANAASRCFVTCWCGTAHPRRDAPRHGDRHTRRSASIVVRRLRRLVPKPLTFLCFAEVAQSTTTARLVLHSMTATGSTHQSAATSSRSTRFRPLGCKQSEGWSQCDWSHSWQQNDVEFQPCGDRLIASACQPRMMRRSTNGNAACIAIAKSRPRMLAVGR